MSRIHYDTHRGIRRLRQLLRLENSECARCDSFRSSRATRVSSGAEYQQSVPANTGGDSVVDLYHRAEKEHEDIKGWTSYKTYSDFAPRPGSNRGYFQYSPLPSSVVGYDGVTNAFSRYCFEMGVSCTVTMDPSDYQQLMLFKVVGDNDVLISHQGKSRVLAPGESWMLKTTRIEAASDFRQIDCLPRISKMVNGNV